MTAMARNSGYRLLIFDWDGTLMDSLANIVQSMQHAARVIGLPERSQQDIHEIIGLGLPEAISALYPELSEQHAEAMRHHYSDSYLSHVSDEYGLYAGVRELLEDLRQTPLLLSIATGKSRRGLDRVLAAQQATHYFHSSRCADEARSKPHPQMLYDLLSYHGVEPADALMIGDTEHDLRMALAAGVDALAVTWGAHPEPRLLACQPVFCARSVGELHRWLGNQAAMSSV